MSKINTQRKLMEIIPKLFVIDLVLGVGLLIAGFYMNNNWFIGLGVFSLIWGFINPNKIILKIVNKKIQEKNKVNI